jgi:hypothetical protein
MTGKDTIDFLRYRKLVAEGRLVDDAFMEEVMPKPKG